MHICLVCGRPVTENDKFIWHGLDGDKIHKECEINLQKTYDWFNNMSDEYFQQYLLGVIKKASFKR